MENSKFGQMENYWVAAMATTYLPLRTRSPPLAEHEALKDECRMPYAIWSTDQCGSSFTLTFGQVAVRTAPEEFVFSISF